MHNLHEHIYFYDNRCLENPNNLINQVIIRNQDDGEDIFKTDMYQLTYPLQT